MKLLLGLLEFSMKLSLCLSVFLSVFKSVCMCLSVYLSIRSVFFSLRRAKETKFTQKNSSTMILH